MKGYKVTMRNHTPFERGLEDGAMFYGLDGKDRINDPIIMGIRAGYTGNKLKTYQDGYAMAYNLQYMTAWKENVCTLLQYAVHKNDVIPDGWRFYGTFVEEA